MSALTCTTKVCIGILVLIVYDELVYNRKINFALIQFDNVKLPLTIYVRVGKRDLWGLGAESWFVLASLPLFFFKNPEFWYGGG